MYEKEVSTQNYPLTRLKGKRSSNKKTKMQPQDANAAFNLRAKTLDACVGCNNGAQMAGQSTGWICRAKELLLAQSHAVAYNIVLLILSCLYFDYINCLSGQVTVWLEALMLLVLCPSYLERMLIGCGLLLMILQTGWKYLTRQC